MNRQFLSNLKTKIYRRPKDQLGRMANWGPRAYFGINRWKAEMEEAAKALPVLSPTPHSNSHDSHPEPELELWFLTGAQFWYQTAFCAWTLAKQSGREVTLNVVDDGSLLREHEDHLRRIFPKGQTIQKSTVTERLNELLPETRFPILRSRWEDYVNIRKLTDVHLGSTGAKLVLDSDMLFFGRPNELLDWWDCQGVRRKADPDNDSFSTCLMTDCEESYGYSRPLMESLSGAPIPELLNVGVCGLRSDALDWEELEYWCRTLLEKEGTSYFLEQALVAMLASRSSPTVMPKASYITFPSKQQAVTGEGVLQHYVSDSKPQYFEAAWKLASTKIH